MLAVPDLKIAPWIGKPCQVSVIGRATYAADCHCCYCVLPKSGSMTAGDPRLAKPGD